jgi:hypothetical protein
VLLLNECLLLLISLSTQSGNFWTHLIRQFLLKKQQHITRNVEWLSLKVPRFPARAGNFSLHQTGAHLASYLMCTRVSFLEDKAARREDDHSPPSSAEFKSA